MINSEEQIRKFFENSYWLQKGEFYPETHLSNIEKLSNEFELNKIVTDALYRISCDLSSKVETLCESVIEGYLNPKDVFEEINIPIFFFFSNEFKKEIIRYELEYKFYPNDIEF